ALSILENPALCPPERRDFPWRYQNQLSQRRLRRLAQQEVGNQLAVISPDCKWLAACTTDNRFRLWDLESGEAGVFLPGHGKDNRLEFSPDSKTLATGGEDGLVKLWSVPSGEHKATLK